MISCGPDTGPGKAPEPGEAPGSDDRFGAGKSIGIRRQVQVQRGLWKHNRAAFDTSLLGLELVNRSASHTSNKSRDLEQ